MTGGVRAGTNLAMVGIAIAVGIMLHIEVDEERD